MGLSGKLGRVCDNAGYDSWNKRIERWPRHQYKVREQLGIVACRGEWLFCFHGRQPNPGGPAEVEESLMIGPSVTVAYDRERHAVRGEVLS